MAEFPLRAQASEASPDAAAISEEESSLAIKKEETVNDGGTLQELGVVVSDNDDDASGTEETASRSVVSDSMRSSQYSHFSNAGAPWRQQQDTLDTSDVRWRPWHHGVSNDSFVRWGQDEVLPHDICWHAFHHVDCLNNLQRRCNKIHDLRDPSINWTPELSAFYEQARDKHHATKRAKRHRQRSRAQSRGSNERESFGGVFIDPRDSFEALLGMQVFVDPVTQYQQLVDWALAAQNAVSDSDSGSSGSNEMPALETVSQSSASTMASTMPELSPTERRILQRAGVGANISLASESETTSPSTRSTMPRSLTESESEVLRASAFSVSV